MKVIVNIREREKSGIKKGGGERREAGRRREKKEKTRESLIKHIQTHVLHTLAQTFRAP